jgi:hypothetical protein
MVRDVARLVAAVLIVLALSACGGGDEAVPAAPLEAACSAAGVRQTVIHMLTALGEGNLPTLDSVFAQPPVFRWYATEDPGERMDAEATDRATLRSYFERRSRLNERMELTSFEFRGRSGGYAQFAYAVTRAADDLAPTPFFGRGVISCDVQRGKLAAWSMAHS